MSVLSRNEMYCSSDLIVRHSSCIMYLNYFLRIGCTYGMLCILNRWNWSDLSNKGICSTTYKVLVIMKDCILMNLYMFQMFLPFR